MMMSLNNQIRLFLAGEREALNAVLGLEDCVRSIAQQLGEELAARCMVLDDENVGHVDRVQGSRIVALAMADMGDVESPGTRISADLPQQLTASIAKQPLV